MKTPAPIRWAAGDQPSATRFNEVMEAIRFLLEPPEAWVVHDATPSPLSFTFSTWLPVTLNYVVVDTEAAAGFDPMWTPDFPTRLYARTPGWYSFELLTTWAVATGDSRRLQALWLNGNTEGRGRYDSTNTNDHKARSAYDLFMNKDDYVELMVYQQSGSTKSFAADVGFNSGRPGIRMKWHSL